MSIEISRRDFLQVIFKTTSAAAVSGLLPYWPKEALKRPISDPVELGFDSDDYLIDINFDWYDQNIPTFREWLGLNELNPKLPIVFTICVIGDINLEFTHNSTHPSFHFDARDNLANLAA